MRRLPVDAEEGDCARNEAAIHHSQEHDSSWIHDAISNH